MKPEAFEALKAKSKAAGRADKVDGMTLQPFSSTRFQGIIQKLSYKQQQVLVKEYAAGYRGWHLDVRTLPGLFHDVNERKG